MNRYHEFPQAVFNGESWNNKGPITLNLNLVESVEHDCSGVCCVSMASGTRHQILMSYYRFADILTESV